MRKKSLGRELVEAVSEAVASKGQGRIVRPKINIAATRKKLGMTQTQFAKLYYINLQTLRNWEQEKRAPDTTSLAYLFCIAKRPKVIKTILHSR